MSGQAVVKIAAHSEIEIPISFRDRILNVQRQLLHVGVAVEDVQAPPRVKSYGSRRLLKDGLTVPLKLAHCDGFVTEELVFGLPSAFRHVR